MPTTPTGIESIVLVGYSMGGLVINAALEAGHADGQSWTNLVEDIVAIGAPLRGTPIEKAVYAAAWSLDRVPHTRPLARFLDGRSQGIQDLRYGLASRLEQGTGRDPAIRHHLIGGVVTNEPRHPMGFALGDLIVRTASSTATNDQSQARKTRT